MVKNAILCCFFLATVGCRPGKIHTDRFSTTDYCFSDSYTGLDTLIQLHGYYQFDCISSHSAARKKNDNGKIIIDTFPRRIVFYANGCYNFFGLEHYESLKNKNKYKSSLLEVGKYKIEFDTLKCLYIVSSSNATMVVEIWFKIINSKTIEEIGKKNNIPLDKRDLDTYRNSQRKQETSLGKFVPYPNLPDPNQFYILRRPWFWCHKEDYEAFMKKHRLERKLSRKKK